MSRRRFVAGSLTFLAAAAAGGCAGVVGATKLRRPVPASGGEATGSETIDARAAAESVARNSSDRHGPSDSGRARVAIVVDDVGVEIRYLESLLAIPAALTFAAIPHSTYSTQSLSMLDDAGVPTIVHLPLQSRGEKPPPYVVSVGMNQSTIRGIVDEAFGIVKNARGVNNHRGDLASAHEPTMRILLQELRNRNTWFMDSYTIGGTVGYRLAKEEYGMPPRINNVFIDHNDDPVYVENAVAELAALARARGSAIGICHATRAGTPVGLARAIPKLVSSGIDVVGLDHVVSTPYRLRSARDGISIEDATVPPEETGLPASKFPTPLGLQSRT